MPSNPPALLEEWRDLAWSPRLEGWRDSMNLHMAWLVARWDIDTSFWELRSATLRGRLDEEYVGEINVWHVLDCPENRWQRIEAPWRLRDKDPGNPLVQAFLNVLFTTKNPDKAYRFFEERAATTEVA
jgi:hypothetical protein